MLRQLICLTFIVASMFTAAVAWAGTPIDVKNDEVYFRAQNLPNPTDMTAASIARRSVVRNFLEDHPNYNIEAFAMPEVSGQAMDSGPLMAIAAGVPPHCIYVNFRQSSTYVGQGFLAPLEELLARIQSDNPRVREVDEDDNWVEDPTDEEIESALADIMERVPGPAQQVVYRSDESSPDAPKHAWAIPIQNLVMGLLYRKDLFAAAGIPTDQPPETWADLFEYAQKMTVPEKRQYGMMVYAGGRDISWGTYAFLVSTDARAVEPDDQGNWRAAYDTRGAAEAIYFVWRMANETFERDGKEITGSLKLAKGTDWGELWTLGRIGMRFDYLNDEVLSNINPQLVGIAPVPRSDPGGMSEQYMLDSGLGGSGSEVNCAMLGVFSGSTPLQQLAVMEFIWYFTGDEALRERTRVYVESGMGKFVSPELLEKFGYDRLLRQVPKGWQEAYNQAMENGVPEPYGRNTQHIYRYMSDPIEEALNHEAMAGMSPEQAVDWIHARLTESAAKVNRELLGEIAPEQMRLQRIVGGVVLALVLIGFAWMMIAVWRYFSAVSAPFTGTRQKKQFIWGYLLLAPALILVIWWQYVPLVAGLSISFMDFQLVRESTWEGLDNFALVLFDKEFWASFGRTIYFVALAIGLGFWPPILLAILLQEVPTNTLKYFYRTVFYLPQVIAGVIVIFLWRQLYDSSESGVLNQLLLSLNDLGPILATFVKLIVFAVWASLIWLLIRLPIKVDEMARPLKLALWGVAGVFLWLTIWPVISAMTGQTGGISEAGAVVGNLVGRFELKPFKWIESPQMAMLCVVIPTVWAGAGPGCILYLAALKTVPDELYEAADIDGASNWHKVFYIVLPRLKFLIMIQFIAAVIGAFKGGTEYVLVLTGGGPQNATQLLSLEIFIRTFMDLKYGIGTAMAWLLGGVLIVFTVYQLRMLSRAEFRAAGSD